jgi:hypothetical protein
MAQIDAAWEAAPEALRERAERTSSHMRDDGTVSLSNAEPDTQIFYAALWLLVLHAARLSLRMSNHAAVRWPAHPCKYPRIEDVRGSCRGNCSLLTALVEHHGPALLQVEQQRRDARGWNPLHAAAARSQAYSAPGPVAPRVRFGC